MVSVILRSKVSRSAAKEVAVRSLDLRRGPTVSVVEASARAVATRIYCVGDGRRPGTFVARVGAKRCERYFYHGELENNTIGLVNTSEGNCLSSGTALAFWGEEMRLFSE